MCDMNVLWSKFYDIWVLHFYFLNKCLLSLSQFSLKLECVVEGELPYYLYYRNNSCLKHIGIYMHGILYYIVKANKLLNFASIVCIPFLKMV